MGITFNYGLLLRWISLNQSLSIVPLIIYIGAIFWTLGYDTIYGFQDIKDDEIIRVKSSSIKFKNNLKKILILCYSITILCLIFLGILMDFNYIFYLFLILSVLHLFLFQIKSVNINSPSSCLKMFKSNNLLGFIIFFNILSGKIL